MNLGHLSLLAKNYTRGVHFSTLNNKGRPADRRLTRPVRHRYSPPDVRRPKPFSESAGRSKPGKRPAARRNEHGENIFEIKANEEESE